MLWTRASSCVSRALNVGANPVIVSLVQVSPCIDKIFASSELCVCMFYVQAHDDSHVHIQNTCTCATLRAPVIQMCICDTKCTYDPMRMLVDCARKLRVSLAVSICLPDNVCLETHIRQQSYLLDHHAVWVLMMFQATRGSLASGHRRLAPTSERLSGGVAHITRLAQVCSEG
jgi:hypothetical protein